MVLTEVASDCRFARPQRSHFGEIEIAREIIRPAGVKLVQDSASARTRSRPTQHSSRSDANSAGICRQPPPIARAVALLFLGAAWLCVCAAMLGH